MASIKYNIVILHLHYNFLFKNEISLGIALTKIMYIL